MNTDFPRPLTTVDLAIFTIRQRELCVLLVRRSQQAGEPFPDSQALPGGFIDMEKDADLVACAKRKLVEKTGVAANYLEQVGSWGNATRDPRGWSATHVYFALIPTVESLHPENTSSWVPVNHLNQTQELAFDHDELLLAAIERLRAKVEYTSLPAHLLPEPFTLPQLQEAYEIVLDRKLDKSSFRTRSLSGDYLQETGLMKVEAPRPAMGYKIKPGQSIVFFPRPFSRR